LEEGREEAVKRLQKHGMDPVEIAEALELPLNTVFKYLNTE
jgi:DNA-binding NarL/FixJ family response regulator